MPRWEGIYEFVQVVDSGSFTAAADALGLSNSQVSKLVARLEDRLGARLLNRTTRKLTLTDEGESFYYQCKQTISGFEQAEFSIVSQQSTPHGRLKINLAGSFQERYIVPVLAEFAEIHPRLSVEVEFTDRPVDVIAGGYDLAICEGPLGDSSLIAKRIANNYHYLCAHPRYLEKHGMPQSPVDLKHHNCLIGTKPTWLLSNSRETIEVSVAGNWRSENGAALLAAARSGLGIARLPFFAVLEPIQAGELVHVLPEWSRLASPVWVIYPHSRHLSTKVRMFVDFLLQKMNATDWSALGVELPQ